MSIVPYISVEFSGTFRTGVPHNFTWCSLAQDPLPEWHQSFDQNTDGWITDETPGEEGWCGDIEQADQGSGPVMPSAGTGYAVVEHGACNDYWTENGFPDGSGPYAPFGGYSESWPEGGYVTELDIYLDPRWEAGTSFTYAVSVRLLDVEAFADSFRYLSMPVTKEGGELLVAGNAVSEAGWYTFRQTFKDEDGHLAADFALVQNDQTLFSQELTTTAYSEEEISSYETSNVGTGYSWFVSLSDGLSLAIDEHRYVPGAAMGEIPETMPETGAGGTFSQNVALIMAGALLVLGGLILAAERRRRNTESGVA